MQMLSRTQEVTSNNLANINTPGFKKDKLFFRSYQKAMHDQLMHDPEAHQTMNMEPGTHELTGNLLDFAIQGNGFFQVLQGDQLFLTRNGRFTMDADGYLKDENGGYVQGQSGHIKIPQFEQLGVFDNTHPILEIAKDGTIRMNDLEVDKIKLVGVTNTAGLERRTSTYLAVKNGTEIFTDEQSELMQGYYETGNVNPLEEMVAMTTNLRLFDSQQRAIRTMDDILSRVTTNLGRF